MTPGARAPGRAAGSFVRPVLTLVTGAAAFGTNFTSPDNLIDTVAAGSAFLAIVAVGMTFVIVSGGIDLSVAKGEAVARRGQDEFGLLLLMHL